MKKGDVMKNRKKIVITGASGFLGIRLLDKFSEEYEVYGPNRMQMDITDLDCIKRYLNDVRPQYIIHCAAVSDIGQCEKYPEKSHEINVTATVAIANAAKEQGSKLVFCSSDQIYLKNGIKTPHIETEEVSPPHLYGMQKAEAEKQIVRILPDAVCLRLSWMYDIQKASNAEHENLYTNIIKALKEKKTMSYPVYVNRSITNVWEVVEQMKLALQFPGGIYNFGSPNFYSTYELVAKMLLSMKEEKTLLVKDETTFKDEPRNLCMDMSKAKAQGVRFHETLEGFHLVFES